ncbi:proline-rich receptor-like protein kinase PERK2 [Homarus americanus]|uniref:proline-rich receptor-like protein kinase PERK2 n=1 Tax=Homarus americanus TaxID=6706 RepID=UPI001C4880D5|nr:proline-rich receptor-like protein kinase PERK2 [Homarus americanus]
MPPNPPRSTRHATCAASHHHATTSTPAAAAAHHAANLTPSHPPLPPMPYLHPPCRPHAALHAMPPAAPPIHPPCACLPLHPLPPLIPPSPPCALSHRPSTPMPLNAITPAMHLARLLSRHCHFSLAVTSRAANLAPITRHAAWHATSAPPCRYTLAPAPPAMPPA